MMESRVYTEIEIAADPNRVWDVLVDFAAYPQWNPFLIEMAGRPIVGETLRAFIRPVGSKGMVFRPTVLAAEPGREFRWLGRLFLPGLVDAEHRFALQPLPGGGARFIHEERFSGVLASLFLKYYRSQTETSFELMNRALKARSEQKEV